MNNIKEKTNNILQSLKSDQKKTGTFIVGGILLGGILVTGTTLLKDINQPVIDVMKNIEITYDENDWNGQGRIFYDGAVDYDNTDPKLSNLIYTIHFILPENNGQLSNGDEVTLKANYSKETAKNLGVKVENTEKTITISGLKEMPKDDTEIPSELIDLIDRDANENFRERFKNKDNLKVTKLYNAYFTGGDPEYSYHNNRLEAYYKIKYSDSYGDYVKYAKMNIKDVEKGQTDYPRKNMVGSIDEEEKAVYKTPQDLEVAKFYRNFFNNRTEGLNAYIFNEK